VSRPSTSGYRKGLTLPNVFVGLTLGLLVAFSLQGRAQGTTGKKTLRIAAAADLQPVMPILAQEYERQTGVKLDFSFGSSSTLATQILNGAPFDCFFGADFVFPEKVVAGGLADGAAPIPYAKGTLVLWARRDLAAPLSLSLLTDPRVTKVAIADEFHAPYGRAGYAVLRQMKILDRIQPKLVVGENIAQTAQFVESGNAQMGLISLTLASSSKFKAEGDYVLFPKVYPEIKQYAVVMKASKNLPEAKAFVDWVRSSKVQQSLPKFGLEPVN
jgi:molybdate transport system substrate-binding protein